MFGSRSASAGERSSRSRAREPRHDDRAADETVVLEPSRPGSRAAPRPPGRARGASPPPRVRLLDLADEWLVSIVALRRAAELPAPERLKARTLELETDFERRAREHGFAAADIEEASFALVAFLDESVMRSRGAAREMWLEKPRQLERFRTNVAGEEFFTRLERLRRERQSRIESLEVCYACLVFGFVGRYGLASPDAVRALLGELETDIAAVRGTARGPLAPHAVRREELAESAAGGVPMWLSLLVFLPALLLVWVVISLLAHGHAGRIAGELRRLVE
jgi:type VI secretion system protein ImpK